MIFNIINIILLVCMNLLIVFFYRKSRLHNLARNILIKREGDQIALLRGSTG